MRTDRARDLMSALYLQQPMKAWDFVRSWRRHFTSQRSPVEGSFKYGEARYKHALFIKGSSGG